jgi:hypothetical protein
MPEADVIDAPVMKEAVTQSTADMGYRFFAQAAGRYEGSGTAQAAYIADKCLAARNQGQNLQASELGDGLLKRRDLLDQIVEYTNNAHDAARKKRIEAMEGPKWKKYMTRLLDPPGPPVVDIAYAKTTISRIFTLAERMSVLNAGELEEILNKYPQTIANNKRDEHGERFGEGVLNDYAQSMINSHL